MAEGRTLPLSALVEHFGLDVLTTSGLDLDACLVESAHVNRPGLQWAGYSQQFPRQRLQIIGPAEAEYMWGLPLEERRLRLEAYVATGFPAAVFTRGLDVPAEAIAIAEHNRIPLLRTSRPTGDFVSAVTSYLSLELAARTVMHAGLVDVYGEGVLILGRSGVGKSETALELIRRGHRMVADDTVEIRRPSDRELLGRAPGLMRHFMEIKGIGIVNLRRMYGIGAVKSSGSINMVVALEPWEPPSPDATEAGIRRRLETRIDILGVPLTCLTIPVQPGRNTAGLIEAAAIAHRARRMQGRDPAAGSEPMVDLFGRLS